MKLVLASASPRRVELLKRLGLEFDVRPTHAEEIAAHPEGPEALVRTNALLKANAYVGLNGGTECEGAWVIGSDTTVALAGSIYGKPKDLDEARRMLGELAGRTHQVFTGVALVNGGKSGESRVFVDSAMVTFKPFGPEMIEHYIQAVNPLDKAGAYGIQACRDWIIESVDGSMETVMGLPIQRLETVLRELGFAIGERSRDSLVDKG